MRPPALALGSAVAAAYGMPPRALALASALALAACGGDGEPATERAPPTVRLELVFDDGEGERRRASLACAGGESRAGGYLADRDPSRLCRAARSLRELLTEPPDRDRVCTQIFGGPQTVRVEGAIAGAPVDRRFARTDGCEIAEFDRLASAGLLP